MNKFRRCIAVAVAIGGLYFACREPYLSPVPRQTTGFLVVDGLLVAGGDSTVINLSRTHSLDDTVNHVPETNAQVNVLGQFGEIYFLVNEGHGRYALPGLPLNPNETYQLEILASGGEKFLSDSIPVRITPPIDSISWKQDSTSPDNKRGVYVYANTHDPSGNTRYYKWDYVETYQHNAAFHSFYVVKNGGVVLRNPDEFTYECYNTIPNSNLAISNSVKLSEDVIFEFPLVFVPLGDIKMAFRYSIKVKQYAITREAFDYWTTLKKNTELTGSIFDPQPSQTVGNIHCVTDPGQVVLGFISAATVDTSRIFVESRDLAHWGYDTYGGCTLETGCFCDPLFVARGFVPVAQVLGEVYTATFSSCVDCLNKGGTTVKPSFW